MCDSPKTRRVETVIEDFPGPVISSYTRKQALVDGALIDVGDMAWDAGFKFPVALTRAAWDDCVPGLSLPQRPALPGRRPAFPLQGD